MTTKKKTATAPAVIDRTVNGTLIGKTGKRLYLHFNDLCALEEATGQSTGQIMERCSGLDMRGIRDVLRYGMKADEVATVEEATDLLTEAGVTACAKAIVAEIESGMGPRAPHPAR